MCTRDTPVSDVSLSTDIIIQSVIAFIGFVGCIALMFAIESLYAAITIGERSATIM